MQKIYRNLLIMSFTNYATIVIAFLALIHQISSKPPAKIIGGKLAKIEDYPAMVSIRYYGRHICGGALISPSHVLTAAHCMVDEDKKTSDLTPFRTWELSVASGSNDSQRPRRINQVSKLNVHPRYMGSKNAHFNDIGIITLVKPVVFDLQNQFPISLPTEYCKAGYEATVIGWGTEYPGQGKPSRKLQKVPALTITNLECLQRTRNIVDKGQLCAFYRKGVGFCDGDSGGPLILNNTVVGIVSLSYDCGAGFPDVYTRVHEYAAWIEQIIS